MSNNTFLDFFLLLGVMESHFLNKPLKKSNLNQEQIAQEIHEFVLCVLVDEEILHEMYLAIKEYKNLET